MANGTYKPRSAGFQEMAVGPEISAILREIAEKGQQIAEGLSADFVDTGDYISSFNVRSDIVELRTGFGTHPVAAGILENTSDHAAAVEWGNKRDSKAHHVLGQTLDALGRE